MNDNLLKTTTTDYVALATSEAEVTSANQTHSDWKTFPGQRRSVPPPCQLNDDVVLIKTGGNALQAVRKSTLNNTDDTLISVSVPEGVQPGDALFVQIPNTNGMVEAKVPAGALPGHTFLVRLPPTTTNSINATASIVEVPQAAAETNVSDTPVVAAAAPDLELNEVHTTSQESTPHAYPVEDSTTTTTTTTNANATDTTNLVLVKIPPGTPAGSKIQVTVPDGRIIEATVPALEDPSADSFYLRLPPSQQNWHTQPVAVAPMVLPFFS